MNTLSDSERRHFMHEFARATDARRSRKECIIPGAHCGTVVEGHTVQRALMENRGMYDEEGRVMSFRGGSMNLFNKTRMPVPLHINHALTEFFSCEKHDRIFQEVEIPNEPDFGNERHLNLLAYKAILGEVKKEENLSHGFRTASKMMPEDEVWAQMLETTEVRLTGKMEAKEIIERQIGLLPSHDAGKLMKHRTKEIPSAQPMVAASAWCGGEKVIIDHVKRTIKPIAMWGCTVYPTQSEHVIIYHYLNGDADQVLPELRFLMQKDPKNLQRSVSADLLTMLESMTVSAPGWETFSGRQRKAISRCFHSTIFEEAPIWFHGMTPPKPFEEWKPRNKKLVNLFEAVSL